MAKKPDVTKMPAKGVLTTLINKDKELNADIAEIKGDLGDRIAKAVKDHNLHAGAFKLAKKLHRMDAVKMLAFLTHFDDYRQKLELDRLAGDSLPLDEEDQEEEEDGDSRGEDETDEQMVARIGEERANRVRLAEEAKAAGPAN